MFGLVHTSVSFVIMQAARLGSPMKQPLAERHPKRSLGRRDSAGRPGGFWCLVWWLLWSAHAQR